MTNRKHIHFIGICGVGMSAIAIALHQKGYYITGSDKGFYPPVSTKLKETGIVFYPGWHVEKMIKNGDPDLVVVGNVAGSTNPEWVYTQEKKIQYKSYPEILADFFIKENSIVCAGNFGKTTTSALIAWILKENNNSPSYMFGGIATHTFPSAEIATGQYSVLEGDEYKTARWDMRPKFLLYKPTHLLLTSISWDHADLYPTEESYNQQFEKLISLVPKNGLIVACADGKNVKKHLKKNQSSVVFYGKDKHNSYTYDNIIHTKNGLSFNITHKSISYHITSPLIGMFMVENICGAFAMAHQLGIPTNSIVEAISNFTGIKRRLEKRCEKDITVFDDIAHSPEKATSVLKTIKQTYTGKIITIFEPNTGNRDIASIPQYANAFIDSDTVIIPRLSTLKKAKNTKPPMDGATLSEVIKKTHKNTHYIEDDEQLVQYILDHTKKEDVVIFLGSHGFRNMIETICEKID